MVILSLLLTLLTSLASSGIEAYQYPENLRKSPVYSVSADGKDITVLPTEQAHVAQFGADGQVQVSILYKAAELRTADIRPQGKGYEYEIEGQVLRLNLKTYDRVSVEINGDTEHPLFIFVNPLEAENAAKARANDRILYFKAGTVYPLKRLTLENYDGMYIEGGAVVRAVIVAKDLKNFKIDGCGILDGRTEAGNAARFSSCDRLSINNLCVLNKEMAGYQFVNCSNLSMSNLKVLNIKAQNQSNEKGAFIWSGCSKVTADRLFAYSQQSAYIINNKFFDASYPSEDFSLTDCLGWNVWTGSTILIKGSEDLPLSDVTVDGFYSLHSAGNPKPYYRCVVKIEQAGQKKVSNLSFSRLEAEDPGEYLLYFSGWITDCRISDVKAYKTAPFGSILRGMDRDHRVENVRFENFTINKKPVHSLKQAGFKNPSCGLNVIVK